MMLRNSISAKSGRFLQHFHKHKNISKPPTLQHHVKLCDSCSFSLCNSNHRLRLHLDNASTRPRSASTRRCWSHLFAPIPRWNAWQVSRRRNWPKLASSRKQVIASMHPLLHFPHPMRGAEVRAKTTALHPLRNDQTPFAP